MNKYAVNRDDEREAASVERERRVFLGRRTLTFFLRCLSDAAAHDAVAAAAAAEPSAIKAAAAAPLQQESK